jgi:hypothetical protein
MNVVLRNNKFRATIDHSFPRTDPLITSVNSHIDSKRFQCVWGTFSACWLLVADAPQGTQAAVFGVDSAFRNIPVAPQDCVLTTLLIGILIHLDHMLNFGLRPAPGIFGHVADAIVQIFLFQGFDAVIKWVDDFAFFRYPHGHDRNGKIRYGYDESLIWSVAKELGWPWAPKKCVPFASSFTYIGFEWSLSDKTVSLPLKKKTKYIERLAPWIAGFSPTLLDCETLISTLNHVTLVIPDGCSHLPSLYKLRSSFPSNPTPWIGRRISASVIDDLQWWREHLSADWCGLKIIRPPDPLPLSLFVDASTSWGIGLQLDGRWLAWKLIEGWKCNDWDIGWAEMVVVELAIRTLVSAGFNNCHVILHSDNMGVVGALRSGSSCNSQQNAILRKIVALFQLHSIWITTQWVASKDNPTDLPSRGLLPPRSSLLPYPPSIPFHLKSFVEPSLTFHEVPL